MLQGICNTPPFRKFCPKILGELERGIALGLSLGFPGLRYARECPALGEQTSFRRVGL